MATMSDGRIIHASRINEVEKEDVKVENRWRKFDKKEKKHDRAA